MYRGHINVRIAGLAAAFALGFGLCATDAEAGRWRRGGRHCSHSQNSCHNYSGSSHGNSAYYGDSQTGCGESTALQGGSCGDHSQYGGQSDNYSVNVTTSGGGSHGSMGAVHQEHQGQHGQYHQSEAMQPHETMRPLSQQDQGGMYGAGQEMAPTPPPQSQSQDADLNRDQQRDQRADDRNSNSDQNSNSNADRDQNSDNRNSDDNSNRNESSDQNRSDDIGNEGELNDGRPGNDATREQTDSGSQQ
jgi:hypothetical protein